MRIFGIILISFSIMFGMFATLCGGAFFFDSEFQAIGIPSFIVGIIIIIIGIYGLKKNLGKNKNIK